MKNITHIFRVPILKRIPYLAVYFFVLLAFFIEISISIAKLLLDINEISIFQYAFWPVYFIVVVLFIKRLFLHRIEVYSDNTFTLFGSLTNKNFSIDNFDGYERVYKKPLEKSKFLYFLLLNKDHEAILILDKSFSQKAEFQKWLENSWQDKGGLWLKNQRQKSQLTSNTNLAKNERNYVLILWAISITSIIFALFTLVGIVGFAHTRGDTMFYTWMQAALIFEAILLLSINSNLIVQDKNNYVVTEKPKLKHLVSILFIALIFGNALMGGINKFFAVIDFSSWWIIWPLLSVGVLFFFSKSLSRGNEQVVARINEPLKYASRNTKLVIIVAIFVLSLPPFVLGTFVASNVMFDFRSPEPREFPVYELQGNEAGCLITTERTGCKPEPEYQFQSTFKCEKIDISEDRVVLLAVCPGLWFMEWICGAYSDSDFIPIKLIPEKYQDVAE